MFSGCPSVCSSVRPSCIRASRRASRKVLARYRTNQWKKFHQTLVFGVVEVKDELISLKGQGVRVKVATRSDMQNFGTQYLLNGLKYHNQV